MHQSGSVLSSTGREQSGAEHGWSIGPAVGAGVRSVCFMSRGLRGLGACGKINKYVIFFLAKGYSLVPSSKKKLVLFHSVIRPFMFNSLQEV